MRRRDGVRAVGKPGEQARLVAARAFHAVTALGHPLDEALAAHGDGLDAREAALARSIATTSIRHAGELGHALDKRMKAGMPRKSGELASILATATAQVLFMAVPDHAAVDTAVSLIRADFRSAGYAGLANAVLRAIASARETLAAPPADALINLPPWLAARWRRTYGAERARAIATAVRQEAYVDLRAREGAASWAERTGGLLLANGSIRLDTRRPIAELPGYDAGAWWVQDAAAAMPGLLLDPKPGERVIDLCAAPGGKTAQLAACGAEVVAIDRSTPRMKRLAENMSRLRFSVEAVVADATTVEMAPADAVLLDAPCSATGTLRRNPDVAWTKKPEDIKRFSALQARLLDRAFALTRPGGRLVYATCSLEPEEGEAQVTSFLERQPGARLAPIDPAITRGFEGAVTGSGFLRILPDMMQLPPPARSGCDGFFIALLSREN